MQFNPSDPAIGKTDLRNAFESSPPARTVHLLQVGQITDVCSDRNDLNRLTMSNFTVRSLPKKRGRNKLFCVRPIGKLALGEATQNN
jgi:hypothetical protein